MSAMTAQPSSQGPSPRPEPFVETLAPCVKKPGVWHIDRRYPTPNGASTAAAQLKSGRLRAPKGRWSFRSEKDKVTGEGILWARYDGPGVRGRAK